MDTVNDLPPDSASTGVSGLRRITFVQCTKKFLEKEFKLTRHRELPALTDWLARPAELSGGEAA